MGVSILPRFAAMVCIQTTGIRRERRTSAPRRLRTTNVKGTKVSRETSLEYFLPILAFALGVVAAEIVKRRYKKRQSDINIHWRQIVVLVEIVLLITAAFLPQTLNTTVNIMISFICAMQVESFRKVRGSAFATTMCTGNLRSGTEQLVIWAQTGDRNAIRKTRNYYSIILFFILGGAIGALTTAKIGEKALLLTCIPLSLVFAVMFVEEEHTLEAEETAGKER